MYALGTITKEDYNKLESSKRDKVLVDGLNVLPKRLRIAFKRRSKHILTATTNPETVTISYAVKMLNAKKGNTAAQKKEHALIVREKEAIETSAAAQKEAYQRTRAKRAKAKIKASLQLLEKQYTKLEKKEKSLYNKMTFGGLTKTEHEIYVHLNAAKALMYTLKVSTRLNSELILMNSDDIALYRNYFENLLTSKNWKEQLCAISALTGRRLNECFYAGSFSEHGTDMLTFSGQLKKRDIVAPPYKIPVLGGNISKEIKEAITAMRAKATLVLAANENPQTLDSYPVTSLSTIANRFAKKHLKQFFAKVSETKKETEPYKTAPTTFKTFRDLYTVFCVEMHTPEKMSRESFRSQILGHSLGIDGIPKKASASYIKFKIV